MRAVVQRVRSASVEVDGKIVSETGPGIAVLLGVEKGDKAEDVKWLSDKIANLRIFEDENSKMNLSLIDVSGEACVVSQFTLLGDCSKGRRPGFDRAALPSEAEVLYNDFVCALRDYGIIVKEGVFAADMLYRIENDGPVTLVLDSRK